jgi:hypothetical protein
MEILVACSDGDRLDLDTFVALSTKIDLGGLYDILEMRDVRSSWDRAMYWNLETNRGAAR